MSERTVEQMCRDLLEIAIQDQLVLPHLDPANMSSDQLLLLARELDSILKQRSSEIANVRSMRLPWYTSGHQEVASGMNAFFAVDSDGSWTCRTDEGLDYAVGQTSDIASAKAACQSVMDAMWLRSTDVEVVQPDLAKNSERYQKLRDGEAVTVFGNYANDLRGTDLDAAIDEIQ